MQRYLSRKTSGLQWLTDKTQGWSETAPEWDELDDWAIELGVKQDTIAVLKFRLPELDISIIDIPSIYQDLLDRGDEIDEDAMELIREWQETDDFVLVWGNEYDIDVEGHVVST